MCSLCPLWPKPLRVNQRKSVSAMYFISAFSAVNFSIIYTWARPKNPLKTSLNLLISVNFWSKHAHFCQFPANFRSFLPLFFAQKCNSPIKLAFSVLINVPKSKKTAQNLLQPAIFRLLHSTFTPPITACAFASPRAE